MGWQVDVLVNRVVGVRKLIQAGAVSTAAIQGCRMRMDFG